MAQEYVAPIDHSAGSAAATTVGGATSGAVKTGVKSWLGTWGIVTLIGAGLGLFGGLLAIGAISFSAATLALSGTALAHTAVVAAFTLGVGALFATTIAPALAGIFGIGGAAIGAARGGSRAANEVKQERGAAAELQAQIDMIRAQNPAPMTGAPIIINPQGSMMNSANPRIQTGQDMQYDGVVNGQQLAAAR